MSFGPSQRVAADALAAPFLDHALMRRVRDGELDALGILFERWQGRLYGYLVKLTGDRHAAADITQTVFHRMLKYRHTYRDDGSFTPWMFQLARRSCADHFRQTVSTPVPTDPDLLCAHADESPHAAEHATAQDDFARLQQALGQLRSEDREVLLLSRIQELSFAEIALILECSAGAARIRAHRALGELRTLFLRRQNQGAHSTT